MAKAELKRLRSNRKEGMLGISSAELVNYMEKKKTQLQKVKAEYLGVGEDKAMQDR